MNRARTARTALALLTAAVLALGAGACGGRATTHHKPGTSHAEDTGSNGRLLKADDGNGHRLRRVDADGAPGVSVAVRPDSEDGWNVHLTVRDFRFTPDSVGGAALAGRGHAQLFLDGHPLARVYGAWFHLPTSLLRAAGGGTRLTAGLYADDHTAWAVGSSPVRAAATLTEAAASADPDATTIDVAIKDGKVTPAPGRTEIKKGRTVRLRVRSDRDDTLHVHGYDKEAELPAGRTVTVTFTADRTGLFEVETHGSDLLLTQLAVR
ncbi:cupredoxin domain-containing protein [Streptomyces sp. NBC_01789]|uniref:cupredoxin domain-containing protein n=1 Tax=Streptomyces sp. NBC_01789 TaxID=2975941 RepID=UPI00225B3217|nr:cupredoxin domain-containing protein [Streptomyces sp. NBC_01789]MCX4449995.1 cupredoxin domain-containing protein [Streptomyces sp. NBC_01789]